MGGSHETKRNSREARGPVEALRTAGCSVPDIHAARLVCPDAAALRRCVSALLGAVAPLNSAVLDVAFAVAAALAPGVRNLW